MTPVDVCLLTSSADQYRELQLLDTATVLDHAVVQHFLSMAEVKVHVHSVSNHGKQKEDTTGKTSSNIPQLGVA